MAPVCVDASLVLLWLLREDLSDKADALLRAWRGGGVQLIGPPLLVMEVASGLRQAVHRVRIGEDEADALLQDFLGMDIDVREPAGLLERAWQMGKLTRSPRLYDMFYVALAESQACVLWTADERLVNFVGARSSVRWVGDVQLEEPE